MGVVSQCSGPSWPRSAGTKGSKSPEAMTRACRFARQVERETLAARRSDACSVATKECTRGRP
eukprot:5323814-Heterocapsa_arctica.AAC.1